MLVTKSQLSLAWRRLLTGALAILGTMTGADDSLWDGYTPRALAQIAPDTTLGAERSQVTANAGAYQINGGATRGANLFHSFSQFSVPTGGSAFFNNTVNIQNIISRVTGGSISLLDGLIRANGTANLFLINSSGIVFGPNATLNIGGSFVASTANSLKFADGTFSATAPTTTPLLSVKVPLGLQFGQNPGSIEVQGTGYDLSVPVTLFSPIIRGSSLIGLRVPQGKTLALVGGDVNIEGGTLTAEQGRIDLGSVGGDGQVSLSPIPQGFTLSYQDLQRFQNIRLSQQASSDASGGGSIHVQGNRVSLTDGSIVLIQNQGMQRGGSISVNAAESFEMSGVNPVPTFFGGLGSEALGGENGADIAVSTQQLVIQDGTGIATSSRSSGKGGNVTVNATDSVQLIGFSPINPTYPTSISAVAFGSGDAGNIEVTTRRLTGLNGGEIASTTFGTGKGGDVTVNALDSIELIGQTSLSLPSNLNAATSNAGNGGNVTVNTSSLALRDGGNISSSTVGTGNAGSVTINARENVEVSDRGLRTPNPSGVSSSAPILTETLQAAYRTPPVPSGDSGNVTINTDELRVTDGPLVDVRNAGSGNAGTLTVNARSIFLDNQGSITAATASGVGGNISLQVQNLQLRDNSAITATAGGTGNGGSITIDTDTLVALENSDITANAVRGRGGNIEINTQGIFRFPDSDITASSQLGINGVVQINTLGINPNLGLANLPVELVDVTRLIAQGCPAGVGPRASKFVVTGRGGLPPNPSETLSSDTVWTDLRPLNGHTGEPLGAETTQPTNSTTEPIVEAQGWVIGPKGEVILTAQSPTVTPDIPWLKPPNCHVQ